MTTPTWPPGVLPLSALIRAYGPLIDRTARRAGVPVADVPDCAQEVIRRFHRAIAAGRLDATRPAGLGGWLIKTTRSVARDFLRLQRHRHEVLMSPETIEREEGRDPEERLGEAVDVHDVVDRILIKMTPEQREVFVRVDLEDSPLEDVIEDLPFGRTVAYEHLKAARAIFRREWTAMQAAGSVAASIAVLTVEELVAAEHVIGEVAPSYLDDVLRRLGEQLGEDFLVGSANGATTAGAKVVASGARVATWRLVAAVVLSGAVGAGLHAVLHPTGAGPASAPTVVVVQAPSGTASMRAMAAPPTGDQLRGSVPVPSSPSSATAPASPPSTAIQTTLLDNARSLLEKHQPAKALPLLARVTAPELVATRDRLRALALRRHGEEQGVDGGAPSR